MQPSFNSVDEKMFEMLSEKKKVIEKKLLRNVFYQFIAIILGLGILSGLIKENDLENSGLPIISFQLLLAAIPIALIVLFIEIGFATGQFFTISTIHSRMLTQKIKDHLRADDPAKLEITLTEIEEIIKEYTENKSTPALSIANNNKKDIEKKIKAIKEQEEDFEISFRSFSIFDELSKSPESKIGKIQYLIAATSCLLIFLFNHFTIFRILQYHLRNTGLEIMWIVVALVLLVIFHIVYILSQNIDRHGPRKTILFIVIISLSLIVYFISITIKPEWDFILPL